MRVSVSELQFFCSAEWDDDWESGWDFRGRDLGIGGLLDVISTHKCYSGCHTRKSLLREAGLGKGKEEDVGRRIGEVVGIRGRRSHPS